MVTAYPESNLPEDVEAKFHESTVWLRTPPLQWTVKNRLPPPITEKLPESVERNTVWFLRRKLAMQDRQGELRAWAGNKPIRVWRPDTEAFPADQPCVAWVASQAALYAWTADARAPDPVQLEFETHPSDVIGDLDVRVPVGEGLEAPVGSVRGGPELRHRETIEREVVDAVRLPAGAELTLSIDSLQADTLQLATGVLDRGFARVGAGLERRSGLSDGMTFVLDAEVGASRQPLWRRTLSAKQVGRRLRWENIDLRAFRGQRVTLRLRALAQGGAAEPDSNAPAADALFDYGTLGMLRFRGEPERTPVRPHVVLISLDTLRADRLSLHGYHRETSPQLDRWAEREAVVFERAASTATWTLPSTTSILTGLSVSQHKVTGPNRPVVPALRSVAQVLREAGYETAAFTGGQFLDPHYGLCHGFDVYVSASSPKLWPKSKDWIRDRMQSEQPLFLFLQTYAVHTPYQWSDHFVSEDYRGPLAGKAVDPELIRAWRKGELLLGDADLQVLSDLYDGEILDLDTVLVPYLGFLEEALGTDRYLLIITSDHGEEFLERGGFGHGHNLFEEQLHVPLLVRFPGTGMRGRRAESRI